MLRSLALIYVSCGWPISVAAQSVADPPSLEIQLDDVFEDMNRNDRPGGAVVAVKEGKVVYLKAFGLASIEHEVPNTLRTRFDVGSLAQPFTAAAVATLVQEGKLTMDDEVRKHLSDLPPWTSGITLRHLLDHRSGLQDWPAPLRLKGYQALDTCQLSQVIGVLRSQTAPAFTPGSQTRRAAINYVLLGEVVRVVSGKALRDYCWERLFKPLKMTRTLVRQDAREVVDHRAFYYNFHGRDGYLRGADGLSVVGSHGLFTSVEDLGKWMVGLDSGTLPISGQLLSRPPEATQWFGFTADRAFGLKRLQLQGDWIGFKGAVQLFPEQRVGVAVLVNWDYSFHNPTQMADTVAKVVLGKPDVYEAVAEGGTQASVNVDRARMRALEGVYNIQPGTSFTLSAVDDRLMLALGERTIPLEPVDEQTWVHRLFGLQLRFPPDPVVEVCYLNRDTVCPRVHGAKPGPGELEALAGTYECKALNLTVVVGMQSEGLTAQHPALGTINLLPASATCYYGNSPAMPMVRFSRQGQEARFVVEQEDCRNYIFQRR